MKLPFACRIFLIICLSLGVSAVRPVMAQQASAAIPNYWDPRERIIVPDLSPRTRIRFLTTHDFPPFNFIDQNSRVSGFHVDLAREICDELGVAAKCQVQILPWDELSAAMQTGQGEAIIAGLGMSETSRKDYLFTRPFLKFPARFVRMKTTAIEGEDATALADKKVGVLANSTHAAMLRAYFPDIQSVTFDRPDWLYDAMKSGDVDAIFGDGVQLSFWLTSKGAKDCCAYFDGPYFAPSFLGEGLSIAVRRDSPDLVEAFDHALLEISKDGRMRELYFRYFPNGLY